MKHIKNFFEYVQNCPKRCIKNILYGDQLECIFIKQECCFLNCECIDNIIPYNYIISPYHNDNCHQCRKYAYNYCFLCCICCYDDCCNDWCNDNRYYCDNMCINLSSLCCPFLSIILCSINMPIFICKNVICCDGLKINYKKTNEKTLQINKYSMKRYSREYRTFSNLTVGDIPNNITTVDFNSIENHNLPRLHIIDTKWCSNKKINIFPDSVKKIKNFICNDSNECFLLPNNLEILKFTIRDSKHYKNLPSNFLGNKLKKLYLHRMTINCKIPDSLEILFTTCYMPYKTFFLNSTYLLKTKIDYIHYIKMNKIICELPKHLKILGIYSASWYHNKLSHLDSLEILMINIYDANNLLNLPITLKKIIIHIKCNKKCHQIKIPFNCEIICVQCYARKHTIKQQNMI